MIIAVDGPSASGKGTLAKALALHFGLRHLDTGALYRLVGLSVMLRGADPADPDRAIAAARQLDLSLLEDPRLRADETGSAASKVAAIPEVRDALLAFQRDFAQQSPGAVLDGRDIGTVICPHADAKLYITAEAGERARRRHQELAARGLERPFAAILSDLLARDARDSQRSVAPLKPAEDSILLDTTKLDKDAALAAAIRLVSAKLGMTDD